MNSPDPHAPPGRKQRPALPAKLRPGLFYAAEDVALHRAFTDQLQVYRAKRDWQRVLGDHFLLENEHDYFLWTKCVAGEKLFVLSASFVSACGRYAFWRLVNRQAPEAEGKLNAACVPGGM